MAVFEIFKSAFKYLHIVVFPLIYNSVCWAVKLHQKRTCGVRKIIIFTELHIP